MKESNLSFNSIFKREIKLATYIIMATTILVLGLSYALFFQVHTNSQNQVVTSGDFAFTYSRNGTVLPDGDSSYAITNSDCFYPMNEEDAESMSGDCSYQFSIQNTGSLKASYQMLLKETDSNTANPEHLKVILRKSNGYSFQTMQEYPKTVKSINDNEGILLSGDLNHNSDILVYSIQIYLDEALATDEDYNLKTISYKIEGKSVVHENQVIATDPDLLTFRIDCAGDDDFYFRDGMTFKDWLKSDLYQGNVGGEFESLSKCQEIWGEDKGCELTRTENYYSYEYLYTYYTTDQEEAGSDPDCTQVNNEYYQLEYSYSYNTLEECEYDWGEDECQEIGGSYIYSAIDTIFPNQADCEDEGTNYFSSYSCILLPVAYRCQNQEYDNYDTMEDCELVYDSGSCAPRTVNYYSPDPAEGTMKGRFDFFDDGAVYVYEAVSSFGYNTVLSSQKYQCGAVGECVSPDSYLLSANQEMIQAKDIRINDKLAYYDFINQSLEIGRVSKIYIHKNATDFVRYSFDDGSTLDVTDYHPIYTKEGWKSYTNRNNYPKPVVGDLVQTSNGYKSLVRITPYHGKANFYDFEILSKDNKIVNNYYANGSLVQGSY